MRIVTNGGIYTKEIGRIKETLKDPSMPSGRIKEILKDTFLPFGKFKEILIV